LIAACEVEPMYTLDAEVVVTAESLPGLAPSSQLRIQFITDERYQPLLARSVDANVLGIRAKVVCREDVTQGKLWAYADPQRRLSKRKKDELDLIRLAGAYPELKLYTPASSGNNWTEDKRIIDCVIPITSVLRQSNRDGDISGVISHNTVSREFEQGEALPGVADHTKDRPLPDAGGKDASRLPHRVISFLGHCLGPLLDFLPSPGRRLLDQRR
jgi:hypothetical protein